MVTASVILPVFRPGGLDITFAGLSQQTLADFELILVDRRYERRWQIVAAQAARAGLRVLHVPEVRRHADYACVAGAWNTGFALAEGEIIIFLPDYAYVEPNWVEQHVRLARAAGPQGYTLCPYRFYELPPVVHRDGTSATEVCRPEKAASLPLLVRRAPGDEWGEFSIFAVPFREWAGYTPWVKALQCLREEPAYVREGGLAHLHVHFRNECCYRQLLFSMNGLDENLDRGKSHIDFEFGRRLEIAGVTVKVEDENWCHILNPRVLFPTLLQTGGPRRWSFQECERYAQSTTAVRAPNRRSLEKLAEDLRPWRTAPAGCLRAAEISDEEYFGLGQEPGGAP